MTKELLDRLNAALAGRYSIHKQIGAGGMATVYLAQDLKHERQVAVKVLRPELAAALGTDRFLREIKITAHLNHPHILPLLDSGDADGLLFYVMPFVEGESLRDRLNREKQLPVTDAVQIVKDIAQALDYAHEHETIHRDIKPENILLSGGVATIADFGIAQAVSHAGGERLTETGVAVGTVTYMSPEQAAGSRRLDGRSDQYSLACVVYETLTGQPPFSGPSAESIAHQHLSTVPASVTSLRPTTPSHVAIAIDRALTKSPADRWATTGDFAAKLSSASENVAGPRSAKRLKGSHVVLLSVLLLVLGLSVALLGGRSTPSAPGRVVIIPFDNETEQTALDPLGRMAAEWISQHLAQTGFVDVVDALTLASLDDEQSTPGRAARGERAASLARQTGARVIVTGAFYADADLIQFRTRIVDSEKGTLLMSLDPVAGSAHDRTGLVSRLADNVVDALAPVLDTRLASWENDSLVPPSYDAYEAYLMGVTAFVRGEYADALEFFGRAVELDSSFHRALLGQAKTQALFLDSAERAEELLDQVEVSQGLLSRYDRESIKHVRALITWDYAGAYAASHGMLEAAPGSIDAKLSVALWALRLNRVDETIRLLETMDPSEGLLSKWPGYWFYFGQALHQAGRFDDEVDLAREATGAGDEDIGALLRLRGLIAMGQVEDARQSLNRLLQRATTYRVISPWDEWLTIRVQHTPTILLSIGREFRAHGFREVAEALHRDGVELLRSTADTSGNAYDAEVLGQLYYQLNRLSEAQTILEAVPFQREDYIIAEYLGAIAARRGEAARARAIADSISQTKYHPFIDRNKRIALAHIAVLLGDSNAAIELLRDVGFPVDRRFGDLHLQADFESLLGNPVFDALIPNAR